MQRGNKPMTEEIFEEMEYRATMRIAETVNVLNFDIYKGYQYYILNLSTHPCSYIVLDETDKLYGKDIDELDETGIYCHGCWSYAEKTLSSKTNSYVNEYEKKWVIGWDYSHHKDWVSYMSEETNLMLGNKKWATSEMRTEIREVIDQIIEYNKEGMNDD